MKYNGKNKYYVKIWITEEDRNQGFADDYYKDFNSLKEAIKEMRKYFYDGNCVCVEIYNSNNEPVYNCDKDSEMFYASTYNIEKVSEKIVRKYIDNWVNKKELPTNEKLIYCYDGNKYIAVDNTTDNCFVEEFDSEKDAFAWLIKAYEKDDMDIEK